MNANELADWLERNAIELPADWTSGEPVNNMTLAATMLRQQQAEIEVLKADLLKYDRLAWDDLDKEKTELTMTFEEMYPIAEKHLGHAIGLYNWKIFGDAILRKAQEK